MKDAISSIVGVVLLVGMIVVMVATTFLLAFSFPEIHLMP